MKEFFLVLSEEPLEVLISAQCATPPPAIAHWDRGNGVFYNELESFSDAATARAFLERYAEVLRRTGWTVLVEV